MMDRLFKKWHIRHLYFWSMTIFVVLLFAVVIWTSYYFSVQGIIRTTSSHQERILAQLNEKLRARFSLIESVSLSAVRNNQLMNLLSEPKESYENLVAVQNVVASLQTLTFSTPSILNIDVYVREAPRSGINDPVRFLELAAIEKEDWYSQIGQSDFAWIGEHRTIAYTGETSVVSFARKFYSSGGDYGGIVMINMKASEVQQLLLEENVEPSRQLFDSGGRLITRVGRDFPLSDIPELDTGERLVDFPPAANGYRLVPGQALVVWTQIKGSGWLLAETTPWKGLVAGSARMAKFLLAIGLTAVAALVLFFFLLNRKFTQPIYLLLRAMNHFPAEKGRSMLPEDYRNEFGQLFHGYRKLLYRIEELYETLRLQYRKQKEAEIGALQAMINPHFLYNTLDQLNWMAIKDGNDRMSHVLELTGKMLRIGLSNGESLIPLSAELELSECYIKIQQIRLGDRIRYEIDVPEETRSCLVPKMTLQPFIENSIRHGFHGRKTGEIAIRCQKEERGLRLIIEDDGKGLPEEAARLSARTRGGYGLRNVRERLSAFFGSGAALEIRGRDEGGTLVALFIPELRDVESGGGERIP
ncbi:sensor histidine kinase [Cohnella sp. REN36]|uniref:cache domain-containing sensor histidine kinase n=1 Tax=Cohnella sp. REN36 TaxID=2887347 RepID=UPI001D1457E2|nr:sensor histidine kinase [Cohnella sp. REN36]MCC3372012.1 sensor histidine kinase [Cohnella sp. REN36]